MTGHHPPAHTRGSVPWRRPTRRPLTGQLLALLVLLTLALLPGCAEGSTVAAAHPTPTSSAASTRSSITPTWSAASTPSDAPAPGTREATSPDPNFDFGFVVQITPDGFHPSWLVSACCKPVTWENRSGSTASVVFDHQRVDSGPIASGGSFVFTPHNVQSITYHSGVNPSMTGALQVNQTFES